MTHLPIIQPASPPAAPSAPPSRWWASWLLRLYRLAVIVAIVWVLRHVVARVRIDTDVPIKVEETRAFFPTAMRLETDVSDRLGLFVYDKDGVQVGYVLRTSPMADHVKGYAGPIDTLMAFDANMKVVGIQVRRTSDTTEHVAKVKDDENFMTKWNGKTWEELAGLPAPRQGWDDVAGASLTSMGIANAIHSRFQKVEEPWRFGWHDAGLIAVLLVACVFTFTHLRSRTWLRRAFQLVLIGYLGFANGQILAQSLIAPWAASGIAWRAAPALTLLLAAALIVPWATRRQLYCSQICPHGAAQELIGRIVPWRLKVPRGVDRGLRWLPPMLVALVLFVTMFQLTLNLADIEPFDAYFVATAGAATKIVAIVGLVAAALVPMAYCKYGCPTGLILSFVRSHGKADRFGRRDVVAALLVLLAVGMYWKHEMVRLWITG